MWDPYGTNQNNSMGDRLRVGIKGRERIIFNLTIKSTIIMKLGTIIILKITKV